MNTNFETFVKKTNWSTETNVDAVKLDLMTNYSREVVTEIADYAHGLVSKLYTEMREFNLDYEAAFDNIGSDDGLQDCLCHLVSQGEEYVNTVLANPRIIAERYRDGTIAENFLYVFPYDDDYEMISLPYYQRLVDQVGEALKTSNIDPMDALDIAEFMDEFRKGEFKPHYSYDELCRLGKLIGVNALIANTWSDGVKYYGK